MKRAISVILSGIIAVGVCLPTAAEEATEAEKILATVKTRIGDTEKYDEFNSFVNEYDGVTNYHFSWSREDEGIYEALNLSTDENGVITDYCNYERALESIYSQNIFPSMNKISYTEALEKARELVKKLNPSIYESLEITQNPNSHLLFDDGFEFLIQRKEDGVSVYEDVGNVELNSDATKITNFSLQYSSGLELESKENILSSEEAWEVFEKNCGMELKYFTKYEDKKKGIYLAYTPVMMYDQYINAKTGEIEGRWNRSHYSYTEDSTADKETATDMGSGSSINFSDAERREIDNISGLLSMADAEKKIREMEILDFDKGEILNNIVLYKNEYMNKYMYRMNFYLNSDKTYKYSNAVIDAKTGELLAWNSITDDEPKEISDEEASELLDNALEKIMPKHFEEFKPNESASKDNCSRAYTRYVNGIEYNENEIGLTVNANNGKITSYNYSYDALEFPGMENVLTEREAFEVYSQNTDMLLYYIPTVLENKENALREDTGVLGYKLGDSFEVDAKTGERLNYYGSENKKIAYTDIDGHYAQKQIEALAEYSIGFETEQFKPDEFITQNDFITLLISTFVNRSAVMLKDGEGVSQQYRFAQNTGIIYGEEANPSETITRMQAAVYMIRMMGLEKIAELDNIYKPIFEDVDEGTGYANLLGAMKVFNGDEKNNFKPDKKLTRADAAILIYNYLNNN